MKQSREHQLIPTIADTLPESYVRMSKYGSLSTHGTCALPPTQPEEQTDAV